MTKTDVLMLISASVIGAVVTLLGVFLSPVWNRRSDRQLAEKQARDDVALLRLHSEALAASQDPLYFSLGYQARRHEADETLAWGSFLVMLVLLTFVLPIPLDNLLGRLWLIVVIFSGFLGVLALIAGLRELHAAGRFLSAVRYQASLSPKRAPSKDATSGSAQDASKADDGL